MFNVHTREWIDDRLLPRGFDPRKHFYCLVCKQKAERQGTDPEKTRIVWFHEGRAFPCVRKLPSASGPVGDTTA